MPTLSDKEGVAGFCDASEIEMWRWISDRDGIMMQSGRRPLTSKIFQGKQAGILSSKCGIPALLFELLLEGSVSPHQAHPTRLWQPPSTHARFHAFHPGQTHLDHEEGGLSQIIEANVAVARVPDLWGTKLTLVCRAQIPLSSEGLGLARGGDGTTQPGWVCLYPAVTPRT